MIKNGKLYNRAVGGFAGYFDCLCRARNTLIVLYIMKLFAKEETKVAAKSSVSAPVAAPAQTLADSDEVIAVISAAVAAMSGNDPTKRLRVMS